MAILLPLPATDWFKERAVTQFLPVTWRKVFWELPGKISSLLRRQEDTASTPPVDASYLDLTLQTTVAILGPWLKSDWKWNQHIAGTEWRESQRKQSQSSDILLLAFLLHEGIPLFTSEASSGWNFCSLYPKTSYLIHYLHMPLTCQTQHTYSNHMQ